MPGRWDRLTVDGETMRCHVAAPDGGGPFPAVVVIQHAGGVDAFVEEMCGRFAEAGFVAVAPELYHRQDPDSGEEPLARMGRLRDAEVVSDVTAAFEHARALPEVAPERIGIAGFCMGGRVAYLMASHLPALRASVVYYGGNIMLPWGESEAPFERTGRIACPVLGLFGEQDTNPSPADVQKIDAELTRLGKQHEFHTYSGVGHAFMVSTRPGYRQDVADQAWGVCLGWLRRHLG